MRFMVMVKATKDSEAGAQPTQELLEAMMAYNEELVKAGIMKGGDGLQPSSKGARVQFDGAKRAVVDGPFAETKELVAGYWLWECASLRGDRLGQALPQPDARPVRDRDPAAVRAGRFRRDRHAGDLGAMGSPEGRGRRSGLSDRAVCRSLTAWFRQNPANPEPECSSGSLASRWADGVYRFLCRAAMHTAPSRRSGAWKRPG